MELRHVALQHDRVAGAEYDRSIRQLHARQLREEATPRDVPFLRPRNLILRVRRHGGVLELAGGRPSLRRRSRLHLEGRLERQQNERLEVPWRCHRAPLVRPQQTFRP